MTWMSTFSGGAERASRFNDKLVMKLPGTKLLSLPSRHGIARSCRHPGHAAEQSRGGEPEAFRETMREHRFL